LNNEEHEKTKNLVKDKAESKPTKAF